MYNINMKRCLCILLLIFGAGFLYSQNSYSYYYSTWEKVFAENKKDAVSDTYASIFEELPKYRDTRIEWIIRLYIRKCEIVYAEKEDKIDVSKEKAAFNKYIDSISKDKMEELKCFSDFIKNNNFTLYDVTLERFSMLPIPEDEYIILTVSRFDLESYKYRDKNVCFKQMRVSVQNGIYNIMLISRESGNILHEVRLSGKADEYTTEKLIELAENHQYADFYGYIEFFQKDRFCITSIQP